MLSQDGEPEILQLRYDSLVVDYGLLRLRKTRLIPTKLSQSKRKEIQNRRARKMLLTRWATLGICSYFIISWTRLGILSTGLSKDETRMLRHTCKYSMSWHFWCWWFAFVLYERVQAWDELQRPQLHNQRAEFLTARQQLAVNCRSQVSPGRSVDIFIGRGIPLLMKHSKVVLSSQYVLCHVVRWEALQLVPRSFFINSKDLIR